ncbi:universal stress protein [Microtetraspora sp. NBRC 13810]|uniref:universal stress protein n=1 Tax=Microtetraspora sp. NBRC 13810 TaxID=3030990 RepID=UPI0024A58B2D|nr:universal stress protein [Microtetraspora sp. NBRC 13810]GLW06721.1 universal stress protein [Microtetraspora sp. NBRC 13810]
MSDWIVAATDGSDAATAAVEWAAEEARLWGRGLRIVHVTGPVGLEAPFADVAGFAEVMTKEAEQILAAAADAARRRAPGVEVVSKALGGAVVPTLIAESEAAGEIVLGSRGHGGFAGLLLGSVGLGVAGHADGAVVVVRERPGPAHGEIVVGYDRSPHAEIAMAYAVEQARRRGARVRAVSAWQLPISPAMADYPDLLQSALDAETQSIGQALATWRERSPGVTIESTVQPGHPVSLIAEAAERADLVVVGTRGHGTLRSAVLGSIGHGVLHNVTCPVAVVR